MYELKDYLNAINFTKENLLDTDDLTWEKKYPPFIINKCLSMHYDCIAQANEMNGFHFLPKKLQFHFSKTPQTTTLRPHHTKSVTSTNTNTHLTDALL